MLGVRPLPPNDDQEPAIAGHAPSRRCACGDAAAGTTTPYVRAAACPSPQAQTVVSSLNELTRAMQQISNPANQISLVNIPLLLIGQGPVPQVITGLNSTAILAGQAVAQISALNSLSGCDADAVADAYRAFVVVSQQTISILIGKSGQFTAAPFAASPLTAALRQVEAASDALAFALIERLPEGGAGAVVKAGAGSLDGTLATAIDAYSNVGS